MISSILVNYASIQQFFEYDFFSICFSFTNIHDSLDNRERGSFLFNFSLPIHQFYWLHRNLDISRAINAESSPLPIASSCTRTGNFWLASANQAGELFKKSKSRGKIWIRSNDTIVFEQIHKMLSVVKLNYNTTEIVVQCNIGRGLLFRGGGTYLKIWSGTRAFIEGKTVLEKKQVLTVKFGNYCWNIFDFVHWLTNCFMWLCFIVC